MSLVKMAALQGGVELGLMGLKIKSRQFRAESAGCDFCSGNAPQPGPKSE